jgi:hypothetical protein
LSKWVAKGNYQPKLSAPDQCSKGEGGGERVAPMKEIRRMLKKTTTVLPERILASIKFFSKFSDVLKK